MSKPSAARRKRRSFSRKLKAEAARLAIDGGRTILDVGKELDRTQSVLRGG